MIEPRHEKRRKGLRFKAEGSSCPAASSLEHERGAVQQDHVCSHTLQANGINPRHRLLALQICKNKTFVLYFNLLLQEEQPALPEQPNGDPTYSETKQSKAYFSKLSQTMTCRVEVDNLSLILMSLQEIVWVFRNFFGAHSLSHV